eukprot:scaffold5329_cov112-Isochrysis_galbana.AAC.9
MGGSRAMAAGAAAEANATALAAGTAAAARATAAAARATAAKTAMAATAVGPRVCWTAVGCRTRCSAGALHTRPRGRRRAVASPRWAGSACRRAGAQGWSPASLHARLVGPLGAPLRVDGVSRAAGPARVAFVPRLHHAPTVADLLPPAPAVDAEAAAALPAGDGGVSRGARRAVAALAAPCLRAARRARHQSAVVSTAAGSVVALLPVIHHAVTARGRRRDHALAACTHTGHRFRGPHLPQARRPVFEGQLWRRHQLTPVDALHAAVGGARSRQPRVLRRGGARRRGPRGRGGRGHAPFTRDWPARLAGKRVWEEAAPAVAGRVDALPLETPAGRSVPARIGGGPQGSGWRAALPAAAAGAGGQFAPSRAALFPRCVALLPQLDVHHPVAAPERAPADRQSRQAHHLLAQVAALDSAPRRAAVAPVGIAIVTLLSRLHEAVPALRRCLHQAVGPILECPIDESAHVMRGIAGVLVGIVQGVGRVVGRMVVEKGLRGEGGG